MTIAVRCTGCGQGYKAPAAAAGRTLKCRACGQAVPVPAAEIDPAAILLGADEGPTPTVEEPAAETDPAPAPLPRPVAYNRPGPVRPSVASLPPLTTNDPPLWRRHLHWLLVLAMIPLATSLLVKGNDAPLGERIGETLEDASPADIERFLTKVRAEPTADELISALPNQRLRGAWLSRGTSAHWGMALVATVAFMVFFMFLATDGSAKPRHVLVVGLFTATVGVGFLLLVQGIASLTEGRVIVGKSVMVLVFYVFKFIAFSYAAASDPDNGFVLSLLGFTFGVGLLEELVKTVPLFRHAEEAEGGKTWRGLFIWGLASGAGFGIAEGILYAGRYYNGITGPGIYLVRFLSCVALHAIWSGSVAITLYLKRDKFNQLTHWAEWIGPLLTVIGVPMVLHGLYDTCLKRDLEGVALLVALASFGWLAFLSSRLYGTDDEAAKRAMLAEYKRRRKAMA